MLSLDDISINGSYVKNAKYHVWWKLLDVAI